MKNPPFVKTLQLEIFSFATLFWTVFLGILYLFLIELFLNYRLLADSVSNHFPLATILSLAFSLFLGSFTSMSAEIFSFIVLLLNALFVGLNVVLLLQTIGQMQKVGKAHISLGGAALFSIVTAGCASCGLSLISVLGLSVTLTFLPFHGAELRIFSLVLLLLSAFYMLRKIHEAKYCKIY